MNDTNLRAELLAWADVLNRRTGTVPAVDVAWKLRQLASPTTDPAQRLTLAEWHSVWHVTAELGFDCTGNTNCPARLHAHGCVLDPCMKSTTDPAPAAADVQWGIEFAGHVVRPQSSEAAAREYIDWHNRSGATGANRVALVSRTVSEWQPAAPQDPAEPTGVCRHCHCAEPIHKTWCTEIDGAATPGCPCFACAPASGMRVMNLCPTCGNKRCPGAANHRNTCTGSNKPGQPGSLYENVVSPGDLTGPASREDTAPPDDYGDDLGGCARHTPIQPEEA